MPSAPMPGGSSWDALDEDSDCRQAESETIAQADLDIHHGLCNPTISLISRTLDVGRA
jgi:hypothetical protein